MQTEYWSVSLKEMNHFLVVVGKIISKCILKILDARVWSAHRRASCGPTNPVRSLRFPGKVLHKLAEY